MLHACFIREAYLILRSNISLVPQGTNLIEKSTCICKCFFGGFFGGGKGIRTLVGLPPNGFQDRLVMTTSISLRKGIQFLEPGKNFRKNVRKNDAAQEKFPKKQGIQGFFEVRFRYDKEFSRPPRYDHFDIPPCCFNILSHYGRFVKSEPLYFSRCFADFALRFTCVPVCMLPQIMRQHASSSLNCRRYCRTQGMCAGAPSSERQRPRAGFPARRSRPRP